MGEAKFQIFSRDRIDTKGGVESKENPETFGQVPGYYIDTAVLAQLKIAVNITLQDLMRVCGKGASEICFVHMNCSIIQRGNPPCNSKW